MAREADAKKRDLKAVTLKTPGRHLAVLVGVVALLFVSCFALVATQSANAALPSACDEYDDPTCIGGTDEAQPDGDAGPTIGGGNNGPGSGDGDGSLPFTGYPLTGLVLLLLVLLALGLTIRAGTALRERFARGSVQ